MNSTKIRALVIVFALLVITSIITVGCKSKSKAGWVNTNSMPGNTFVNHRAGNNAKRNNSTIVYLGSDSDSSGSNFGPKDVSFEFKDLKK